MCLVMVESGIGLVLALGAGRLLAWTRFGLSSFDPVIFASAILLFAVVGLAACAVPVGRATRINAMDALRYE
jgi:ABC-type antimicrobial peptide transport system permease subunit